MLSSLAGRELVSPVLPLPPHPAPMLKLRLRPRPGRATVRDEVNLARRWSGL